MEQNKNVAKIIKEVCQIVCDDLCKYAETTDDDYVCDYQREHGECPLDRLM